jgi:holin-like protein
MVEGAASFLLSTMIFYFVPSVVGAMNIGSVISMKFIAFIIVIIVGTCCVALISGYIAEKMIAKTDDGDEYTK